MSPLEPGVAVTWLRTEEDAGSFSQTLLLVEPAFTGGISKCRAHLQGKVDLILDVFDDVSLYPGVMNGIKHVPEAKPPF